MAWLDQLLRHLVARLAGRRVGQRPSTARPSSLLHVTAALADALPRWPAAVPLRGRRVDACWRLVPAASSAGVAGAGAGQAPAAPRRLDRAGRLVGRRRRRRSSCCSCFQKRTMLASKMMSASMISPVSGLARDGPMAKPLVGGDPAEGVVVDVFGVEVLVSPAGGPRWRRGSRSSRTPCSTRGCPRGRRRGTRPAPIFSIQKTIFFLGGDELVRLLRVEPSARSSRQRLT